MKQLDASEKGKKQRKWSSGGNSQQRRLRRKQLLREGKELPDWLKKKADNVI